MQLPGHQPKTLPNSSQCCANGKGSQLYANKFREYIMVSLTAFEACCKNPLIPFIVLVLITLCPTLLSVLTQSSINFASSTALLQSKKQIYKPSLTVIKALPTTHPVHNPASSSFGGPKHKNNASGTATI
jgi:hypothetical protein